MQIYNGLGRRKSAVARVYLREGKGNIVINGRDMKDYFQSELLQYVVMQPLNVLNVGGNFDIKVTLDGGGVKGQAEAVRLGISRALVEYNPDNKPTLKANGFMTRDSRSVERKKPGRPKARKRFQFSKR
ncbi:MAG: 30S ribosomal protein S9 [Bacteroidales bacterium]|jgi:small subunit ribosomal protein S9|nr:30S ribosomal protein S9 [Bacteroidales bacterium]HOA09886.1 30S ribosomal protein S9 [Tenuifilaceae bacterium]MBP8643755.1 30S ribosomal protein S9 [Bacteroidales bacterium]NLI86864.1 30S ribosomal protein S9 [Bacteroidales bacterium]HOC36761.1 30S ribosomal protein S9 [Tenuifilaceae bacterium]